MFECEIIEVDDFEFNHYIHHFEEYEDIEFDYKNELDLVYNVNDCMYDIDWE